MEVALLVNAAFLLSYIIVGAIIAWTVPYGIKNPLQSWKMFLALLITTNLLDAIAHTIALSL